MANTFSLIIIIFSLLTKTSISELSLHDLESAIFALRANGYNLFGNSIAVSDLAVQILSHSFNSSINGGTFGSRGFTFLAPPNSALFSLDMSTDAFTYVHSLRFHVIPKRFSFSELRNVSFSVDPYVETLVPRHHLFVASSGRRGVAIEGVRIAFPDLYLRPDIAVHGLEDILVVSNEEFSHRIESHGVPPVILRPSPPPIEGSPLEIGDLPVFSPEVEKSTAKSPYIGGFQPFPSEYVEIPESIDEVPAAAPIDAISPEIPPITSPVTAYSPEYDVIPASHDLAFTGGTYTTISVPPIHGYSFEDDVIPAPSPLDEYLSPNEHSISPEYNAELAPNAHLSPSEYSSSPVAYVEEEEEEDEVTPAVVPSPNRWSTQPWSGTPEPGTVGWVENWGNVNKEEEHNEQKESENVGQGNSYDWKN